MNKRITAGVLAFLLAASPALLSGCFGEEEETVEQGNFRRQMEKESDFDNPEYDLEGDGEEVQIVTHDQEDFIGSWVATSKRAEYLWGNVNLTIKESGTWKGNITEENFRGKWRYDGSSVIIKDVEGLINWRLFYAQNGMLMFENIEEPGDPIVLKPARKGAGG